MNATNGQVVAGGNGYGSQNDQLYYALDVIVDRTSNSLIICDRGNRRVVRWPLQNGTTGEIVLSDIGCSHATMDHEGCLYISTNDKHEVRRYEIGQTNGTIVAGGNGQGNRLNQLNGPGSIFINRDCSIYVSDGENNRVVKWIKGAREGIIVAGGQGRGDKLTQLSHPEGLFVDHLENIYVCDSGNRRVMYWFKGSKDGQIVVGGNGKGNKVNQLDCPHGLAFDRQGNLYVSDYLNHRIQKFDIESS